MKDIKSVCVYCASRVGVDKNYVKDAARLGQILAENGLTLIYGGGTLGLMGAVAEGALQAGGEVIGVIPRDLMNKEGRHGHLSELHIVKDMHERKMMMAKRADAIAILPGGFGTRDELFEILTWKQLGFHDKPVIFVNTNDYWCYIKQDIQHAINQGFADQSIFDLMIFINTPDDLLSALEIAPEPRWPEHIEDAVPRIYPDNGNGGK